MELLDCCSNTYFPTYCPSNYDIRTGLELLVVNMVAVEINSNIFSVNSVAFVDQNVMYQIFMTLLYYWRSLFMFIQYLLDHLLTNIKKLYLDSLI